MLTRENTKLALVAAFCLLVGLAGPSVAGAVQKGLNADQVDGKHAVGAKAPVAKRKNKLVATNKQGYLPSNIIKGTNALRAVWVPGYAMGSTEAQDFYGPFWPDGQSDSINVKAMLPPNYPTGAPVTLDVTYIHGGGPCTLALNALGDRTSPSLGYVGSMIWRLPSGSNGGANSLPGPTGTLRLTVSSVEGQPLRAGDTIGVRIGRLGGHVEDICAQSVYVYGAQLRF